MGPGDTRKRGKDKEALQEGLTSAAASARDAASIAQCRTTSNPAVDACPGLALGLALRCRATVARSAGRPGPGMGKHFRPTFVRPSVRPPTSVAGFRTRVAYFHSSKSSSLGHLQLLTFIHPPTTVAGFRTRVA